MDLRMYYQKVRDAEATIPEPYVLVVSHETGDGGKGGVPTEVTRKVAAKMLVDGGASLASSEQLRVFLEKQTAALRAAQEAAAAARVEITVVTSEDLRKLKGGSRSAKE
jgi:hypothetical protein